MNGKTNKWTIPVVVIGCDFRRGSTIWRSEMILTNGERKELLKSLHRMDRVAGLVVLATCNRTEWIISAENTDWIANLIYAHLHDLWQKTAAIKGYMPQPYVYKGKEATRHIFRVVAGLESFVVGEQQIARQFHIAFRKAREEKASSSILNGLDKIAGALKKRLKIAGLSRRQSVGIHSVVCRYVNRKFADQNTRHKGAVAVVGMGEIGRKVAGLLEQSGNWKVFKVNRTLHSAGWISMEKLSDLMGKIDGLIVCTGADNAIIKLSEIMKYAGKARKLWVVDIGVPNQVEKDVATDDNYVLIDLDTLVKEPEDEMSKEAILKIEVEVEKAVEEFEMYCRERDAAAFLEIFQSLHKRYIGDVIPRMIEENYSRLSNSEKKRLVSLVRQIIIDYSDILIKDFHRLFGVKGVELERKHQLIKSQWDSLRS